MDINVQQNLDNLHHFWSTIPFSQHGRFRRHKSWPYKLWLPDFATASYEQHFTHSEDVLATSACIDNNELQHSSLLMMNLPLPSTCSEGLSNRVSVETNIKKWTNACSKAFGYEIDELSVAHLAAHSNNQLLSLKIYDQVAVTAILHQSKGVSGLHQMGALPDFRGQGLAKEMMKHLIMLVQQQNSSVLVLQASKAGLPLYQKLGFSACGTLHSYRRR